MNLEHRQYAYRTLAVLILAWVIMEKDFVSFDMVIKPSEYSLED